MSNSQEIFKKANNPYMSEWTCETVFDILHFQIRKITHREYEKGDDWYPGTSYISEVYYAIFLKRSKAYIDYLYSDIKEAKWDLQRLQSYFNYSIPLTAEVEEE